MALWELFITAVSLSMDAFAVSICKGLTMKKLRWAGPLACGLYFGIFQAVMPLIGYLVGSLFYTQITGFDHWIAFGLLVLIGGNMVREALSDEDETVDASFGPRSMLPMAVATSIDALAVGVSFACLQVQIVPAVTFIGAVTFAFSFAGVWIGHQFGARFRNKAVLVGGVVLILIGVKILLQHLGVLPG